MVCSCELVGMGVVVVLTVTFSKKANYYFKMATFLVASTIGATLPIPLMLLRPYHHSNALFPAWACLQTLKLFGVTYSASGVENIDHNNGAIVLLNHQSAVDLGFLAVLWPLLGRAAVVAKRQLMYIFPFGLAVSLWGTIFIDRARSKEAKNTLDKECDAIANGKKKLLFFPEGTRHQGRTLLPFKKGPFYIAIKTQCPIQPVVCSRYHFLDAKTYRFSAGHSLVKILPEVPTKGLTHDDMPALMERLQAIMQREYEIVTKEAAAVNNIQVAEK